MSRLVAISLVGVILLGVGAAPGHALTEDEPRFDVYTPSPRLEPGEVQTVTVELVNDAEDPEDDVPPATAVRVEPRTGSTPFGVRTGSVSIGRMEDGEIHEVTVRLSVPTDAPGGTYRLPLRVGYEYDGDERERTTVRATVRVPHRPIFRVSAQSSSLRVNESGTVNLTIKNDGSRLAREAVLDISTSDLGLTLDGRHRVKAYVGTLSMGETQTVTVKASATDAASSRAYPLEIRPTYAHRDNTSEVAPTIISNVSVGPQQGVNVRAVSVEPYGTTGVLRAAIENSGPAPVQSAVATLMSSTEQIQPIDKLDHIGSLNPGNSTNVSFIIRIHRSASTGPHPLEIRLRYNRGDAETATSDPASFAVTLPIDRSSLEIEAMGGTLEPGASNTITVQVRNAGRTRLVNLQGRLEINGPYQSAKSSAFIRALEPKSSTNVSFEVAAPEGTVSGSIPLALNLTGELPDGRMVVDRDHVLEIPVDGPSPFTVEMVNGTLEPDSSNTVVVRLTSEYERPLTDLRATIEVTPPYESAKPSAFIEKLAPGDSTQIAFEVTAPDDAVSGTDSLPLQITGELPDGRTVHERSEFVTLTYPNEAGSEQDVVILAVGAIIVLLVLGAGIWWLRH